MRYDLLDIFMHSATPEDRRRDLLFSSVGAFGLAIVAALVARWLLLGGLGDGGEAFWEAQRTRSRYSHDTRADAAHWLTIGGGIVALLSLLLALVGLYSLAAAFARR